jgi:hypothetical protein
LRERKADTAALLPLPQSDSAVRRHTQRRFTSEANASRSHQSRPGAWPQPRAFRDVQMPTSPYRPGRRRRPGGSG